MEPQKRKKLLFVEHSPEIHSAGFRYLDVEQADYRAMKDIEHCEYQLCRFIRPSVKRSKGERSEV